MSPVDDFGDSAIAIVGLAGRFPGARDATGFWQNLRGGVESIRPLSDAELISAGADPGWLRDPSYVKAAGLLDDLPMFDASFFGVSPKDAGIMDPQHRHFLECAVTALEHAGFAPRAFPGSIGVFAGCGMNAYFVNNLLTNPHLLRSVGLFLLRHTGNDRDFLPTSVSYKLDLRGPSVAIQTACSTSLVAIHVACQSLLAGECDLALAGGVTILVPHGQGYFHRENEPVSPDGHCRPFDRRAAGTVVASGCGVVVLRRLSDALQGGDTVHAVIRGSAINNDGAGKVGYLAPSVSGHASVVSEALALAGVSADTISYVEAHGTGTPVGDPIEIAALTQAFRQTTERTGFCAIGSLKSNVGHLDTAAGVASLIKVVKALEHRELPPSLHFEAPNPEIDFAASPFRVNAELRPWPGGETPRRAGISSLGIGGTNAHVIVEEAPEPAASDAPRRAWQILPLAAKSQAALDAITDRLATHLRERPDTLLADAAFTLQEGREPWDHRRVVVARSAEEAQRALEQRDAASVVSGRREGSGAEVAFLFSGAGAQYPGMGRDLYEAEPVYREAMDRCLAVVRPLVDFDLVRWLYPKPGEEDRARTELERPSRLCPAIVATEWALAALWRSWGVEPVALIGHSLGEYTAACMAGVVSLPDALRLVVLRGALVDRLSGGAMLSVQLPEPELRALLGDELDLAAVNGPVLCVVSGRRDRVEALAKKLAEQEVECRLVPVDAAGHSRELDPILAEFERGLRAAKLEAPRLPYVSNVTGTWVRAEDAQSPAYWLRHFRETVRFAGGLRELVGDGTRALLEVGPGQTLLAFARQQQRRPRAAFASLRRPDEAISDVALALRTLGGLWSAGAEISFRLLRGPERRRRIPLPTYPFEHRAYWIEPGRPLTGTPVEAPLERLVDTDAWFRRPAWKRAPPSVAAPSGVERWLVFLDTAGVGLEVSERLRAAGQTVMTVRLGDTFYRFGEHEYALAPEAGRIGYDALLSALAEHDLLPDRVAHFWSITEDESSRPGSSFLHRTQECGFWSLFFLAQALGDRGEKLPSRIDVFSTGMQSVAGEPLAHPEKATLLGPVRVVPHELAGVRCRSIDLLLPGHERRRRSAGDALAPLVETLVAELLSESSAQVVAWRGGERFEEVFEPATPPAEGEGKLRLRPSATVLVTGGLGGIGLALSAQLAKRHGVRLVLVGRTALPPEEGRERWLASHGERDPTSRRLRALRALEAAGAEVMVADADVADVERMSEVVDEARRRFGAIHGVLHAAGAVEEGVIQAKTPESVERVLAPKLHGTLVLARLLADEPLEFFAAFSSASAVLGPPGQVDYVAANCFLNAFAEQRATTHGGITVALDWGPWKEVGGAVALAGRLRGEAPEPGSSRATGHPLLGECVIEGPERWRWIAEYRVAEHWVLDEHRTRARSALLPGTAYLEIARAAWQDAFGAEQVEIRDLSVLSPLAVPDDAVRAVETELIREPEGASFEVRSLGPDGQVHARGRLLPLHEREPACLDLASIEARCGGENREAGEDSALASPQEAQLAFGPRWSCLRRSAFGASEAFAWLELSEQFSADLANHALHAALLDVATGFGLPLLPGFESGRALWVPMGYERIRVRARLPGRIASLVRSRPGSDAQREVATFDVTLTDSSGDVLVEVEGLSLRRLDPARAFGEAVPGPGGARAVHHGSLASPGERLFLETFETGLSVNEGAAALARVLSGDRSGPVLVSPIDLERWHERLERVCAAQSEEPAVKFERPELESRYEAARDEIEEKLAACFGELLGVDRVGIHDDFFALGGHSLNAVRLFAKAKKLWGVEYPLSLLFEAPTVAALAERVRADTGAGPGGVAPAASRSSKHRFLVPMNQVGETRKLPFFLVAGMFGNVLNLRHLAAHLGKDQPVVAIQARGLYGEDPPHQRFEEMAEDYLREVRMLQPEGPYLLGGFSGGGVTAFEMAHQLIAQGEEIAALILLDAIPPTRPEPSWLDRVRIQWQRLTRQGPAYAARWARNRLRWELEKRQPRTVRELTPAEFRSGEIEAGFREALAHYPMRVYPGKVSLFRPPLDASHRLSGGRLANAQRELVEPQNFWRPWVSGDIDVQVVPGDHDAMVLEPSVRVLATRVRAVLEAAQRKLDEEIA